MIKMQNAYTNEIDDPEIAVAEILGQLDLGGGLLKNSVAVIACHYEYAETGVVAALGAALPFDLVGCTTIGSAVNGHCGTEQLSVLVLTSDDIAFAASFSEPLSVGNVEKPVVDAYARALEKLGGEPSLILAFGPITTDLSGEFMLKCLDRESGGTPVFGTLSNDTSPTYEDARVICNGEVHQHKVALILLRGALSPRFHVTAVSEKNIQQQTAVVTESDGYMLKKINGLPLTEYLASIGVTTSGLAAVSTLPLLVDYKDGAKPVARSMYAITEDGALCGGEMPVGTEIAFAEVDYNSVMETAELTLRQALADVAENGANGIIAIPCFSRSLVISPNSGAEMEKSIELMGDAVPFALIYSGGELCPVYNREGGLVNRFHNLTYTLMVF
ncbi:MAG: FIST C-terminal domain-containing protein [Oscillospiraceae bacterium]|nr:FIST C-terminal domain-containing protein [Oscillospiraceae bacterium]